MLPQLVVENNTRAMEYILGCFDFLGIHMPNEKKADKKYNETEADEFYTAESKMLVYLTIMGQIKKFMDRISANGDTIIDELLSFLEHSSAELIVVGKDVLIT